MQMQNRSKYNPVQSNPIQYIQYNADLRTASIRSFSRNAFSSFLRCSSASCCLRTFSKFCCSSSSRACADCCLASSCICALRLISSLRSCSLLCSSALGRRVNWNDEADIWYSVCVCVCVESTKPNQNEQKSKHTNKQTQ